MRRSEFFNKMKTGFKYSLLVLVCCPLSGIAQYEHIQNNPGENQNGTIRVFIDYAESDDTERYLRSAIPFVTYVRDPHLAQIHILITDEKTGSGGRQFNIYFIGHEKFSGEDLTLYYNSPQSDTDDQLRNGLTRIIKMGLMPYVSQTAMGEQVEIRYDEREIKGDQEMVHDNWDYWIFSIDLGGGFSAEESRNAYRIISAVAADRVTEQWKINNLFEFLYEEENFKDDDKSLKSSLKDWQASSGVVKSMNIRWSVGLFGELFSTTYKNISLGWDIAPGIEYNIFPWMESERRKFTLGYQIGYASLSYYQETLFDRNSDDLLYHAFEIELKMVQPWGNVEFDFETFQYLELKDKYSLNLDVEIALRITSGWEFVLESQMESIHDQIYLPKGDATIDEILLRRRQLATTYNVGLTLGFRYTFGSIYNNIINRRF